MAQYALAVTLSLLTLFLTSCGSYDLTVNDRVVFSPKPLFTDYEITDEPLSDCVQQAIVDNQVSSPAQLSVLNCSHAGVVSLAGLQTFTGLSQLKLSANQIVDLTPLTPLSSLEDLYLDQNQIVDATPLFELLSLRSVDLTGNPGLRCPGATSMLRVEDIRLPKHCG
jgi:Leucine-rich repeat (LRR) protein